MIRKNEDIRKAAVKYGIPLWMIAEHLGLSPSWFSVKLRKELSGQQKEEIHRVIQQIISENEGS